MSKHEANEPKPILCTRRQAAQMLGASVDLVRLLEKDGRLSAIKLRPGRSAKTFYKVDQVAQLAEGTVDAS